MGQPTTIDTLALTKRLFVINIGAQLVLLLADLVFNYWDVCNSLPVRRIWNIAREQSIPTWYACIQMQLLGLTVYLTGATLQATRMTRHGWQAAGLFFVWLGVDDFASIHERLGSLLADMAMPEDEQRLSFSWHSVIAPIYALLTGAVALLTVGTLLRRGLLMYLLTGLGLWFMSQALDFIEGMEQAEHLYDTLQQTIGTADRYAVTHGMKVIEECMEMLGTTYLWVGFLHVLAGNVHKRRFALNYRDGAVTL